MRRSWQIAAVVAIAATVSALLVASVNAAAPPDVFINRAFANRNIIQDASGGDLVFLMRYELPISDSDGVSDAWCQYLLDDDGCDLTPAAPTDPTSLPNGYAFGRLVRTSTGATVAEQTIQRIDHSLLVIYVGVGHGLTWGDTDLQLCVESAAEPTFDSEASNCSTIDWSTAESDMTAQREDLGDNLVTVMRELELERSVNFGTFVSNGGLISPSGQVFTREQQIPLERIVPDIFATGGSPIGTDPFSTPTGGNLASSLATAAATTTVGQGLEGVAREYGGIEGETLAALGFVFAGTVVGLTLMAVSKGNPAAGGVGFFATALPGVFIGGPNINVLLSILLILGVTTSMWALDRLKS